MANRSLLIAMVAASLSSIVLVALSAVSALPGKDSIATYYDLDKRTRVRTLEPTHVFEFRAYSVCNEKYNQCFDIWGDGSYNFKQVAAKGNYVKYVEEPNNVLESSWWRDVDFISASESDVNFRAEPAVKGADLAGFIVLEILEGKTSDTGRVCVYGNLFDKQYPSSKDDADCTNSAFVRIEPIG